LLFEQACPQCYGWYYQLDLHLIDMRLTFAVCLTCSTRLVVTPTPCALHMPGHLVLFHALPGGLSFLLGGEAEGDSLSFWLFCCLTN
jgi:hypothetical protein